jgi:hypothetical protein
MDLQDNLIILSELDQHKARMLRILNRLENAPKHWKVKTAIRDVKVFLLDLDEDLLCTQRTVAIAIERSRRRRLRGLQ